jgi:hypothetical protein
MARLRQLRELAVLIMTSLFGLGAVVAEVIAISNNPGNWGHHAFSIVRLTAVTLLLIAWWLGTVTELDAFEHLVTDEGSLMPELPRAPTVLVTLAALALAFMALGYWAAVICVSAFVLLKCVEVASYPLIRDKVRGALEKARSTYPTDESVASAAAAVESYYLVRPWPILSAAIVFVASIAAAIASYGEATSDQLLKLICIGTSSILLLLLVMAQETVTFRWRGRFTRELDEAMS